MYKRYYDGYPTQAYRPDEGETIVPDTTYALDANAENIPDTVESQISPKVSEEADINAKTASFEKKGLFSSLKSDDVILIALLILLAAESPDDIIMPLIIGYLLIGDFLPI